MNNTARIAFAVLMTAAPAAAQISDSLTIGAALETVLANNPSLQETARSIDASRARVELSRGAYYPTAGIDASYLYMTPIPEIDFLGLSFKVAPNNNYDAHIGASQMIGPMKCLTYLMPCSLIPTTWVATKTTTAQAAVVLMLAVGG